MEFYAPLPHTNALGIESLSRRKSLQAIGAGLAAFYSPLTFTESRIEAAVRSGTAKRVIMIFNCGAPSHHDLWDPKPLADSTVRGEFQPIETNVSGIQVSELLPEMAKRMDKLAIIRSVHHKHSAHNSGMYWSIAGRPYKQDSTLINPSPADLPSFGTLIGWLAKRDGYSKAVPPYVITPKPHCDSFVYLTPGQFGGCLGVKHDPFVVNDDPNSSNFKVRNLTLSEGMTSTRFERRLDIMQQLGSMAQPIHSTTATEMDTFHNEASRVISSGEAGDAFDLSKEPDKVRDRYGRHSWGQSHLLARRLIEAGTRFVSTVNGPSITWDTHKDNFNKLKNSLVPPMEKAYAALIDDLDERGLLDETLVIWMGDFGRTPKINNDAGRDHWPGCYSVVLAGGGIKGGQVIGSSDKIGAYPDTRPVTPGDIHATVYWALGYDPSGITFQSVDGRPIPLTEGMPIPELLG
ncbi:DUF1501 domain-containing protein [uncultured Rubinisphaera sp.]|uniref:DUF1501 domain-containing protein n=1 Tax=uncultured Rubinisphaera sp. TaxID=1678686 RepID=UPI0030DAC168